MNIWGFRVRICAKVMRFTRLILLWHYATLNLVDHCALWVLIRLSFGYVVILCIRVVGLWQGFGLCLIFICLIVESPGVRVGARVESG